MSIDGWDLVDEIYAAALDAGRWPSTLRRLADAFGALQCSLYSHRASGDGGDVHFQCGLDPPFLRSYAERFGALNPFVPGMLRLPAGASATAADLMRHGDYTGGEFFNDWVRPQRCQEFLTAKLRQDGSGFSGITVLRDARRFTAHERRRWSSLVPHLRRALQVHDVLGSALLARDGAVEALDRLSVGIVLTGAGGEILFSNAAAEAAARSHGGIRVRAGRLVGETADASDVLCRTIDAAVAAGRGRSAEAGGLLAMPRRSGPPLPLLISPVSAGGRPLGFRRPAALVLLGGERRTRVAEADLVRAFALTPAEARLLVALVDGDTLSTYAARHGIAVETVRAHLRRVLAKTGSNRQVDAVRRVLSDPALIHAGRTAGA